MPACPPGPLDSRQTAERTLGLFSPPATDRGPRIDPEWVHGVTGGSLLTYPWPRSRGSPPGIFVPDPAPCAEFGGRGLKYRGGGSEYDSCGPERRAAYDGTYLALRSPHAPPRTNPAWEAQSTGMNGQGESVKNVPGRGMQGGIDGVFKESEMTTSNVYRKTTTSILLSDPISPLSLSQRQYRGRISQEHTFQVRAAEWAICQGDLRADIHTNSTVRD